MSCVACPALRVLRCVMRVLCVYFSFAISPNSSFLFSPLFLMSPHPFSLSSCPFSPLLSYPSPLSSHPLLLPVISFNTQCSGVDIRGEHDNFVLAVDTNGVAGYTSHVIFDNYDSSVTSYFVVERANLPSTSSAAKTAADVIFYRFTNVAVKDKYPSK